MFDCSKKLDWVEISKSLQTPNPDYSSLSALTLSKGKCKFSVGSVRLAWLMPILWPCLELPDVATVMVRGAEGGKGEKKNIQNLELSS